MRILFDQGTPVQLRKYLKTHAVSTAFEMGWSTLKNGDLRRADSVQFDVFITTDQKLKHEQKLGDRHLAILVLPFARWPKLQNHVSKIVSAVDSLQPGAYVELNLN